MNAGFVGEGVLTHNGFVRLNLHSCDFTHQTTGFHDLFRHNCRIRIKKVFTGAQSHDHFFKCRIACTLSNPVDRTLNLSCSSTNGTQRICNSKPQIIMTMHGNHGLIDIGNLFSNPLNQQVELFRGRVSDGIGNVDCCRPRSNHGFQYLTKIVFF